MNLKSGSKVEEEFAIDDNDKPSDQLLKVQQLHPEAQRLVNFTNSPEEKEKMENDEEFDPATKKKILVAILMALTIGNMMINNVVTLLPSYIE